MANIAIMQTTSQTNWKSEQKACGCSTVDLWKMGNYLQGSQNFCATTDWLKKWHKSLNQRKYKFILILKWKPAGRSVRPHRLRHDAESGYMSAHALETRYNMFTMTEFYCTFYELNMLCHLAVNILSQYGLRYSAGHDEEWDEENQQCKFLSETKGDVHCSV